MTVVFFWLRDNSARRFTEFTNTGLSSTGLSRLQSIDEVLVLMNRGWESVSPAIKVLGAAIVPFFLNLLLD
jgi:hypothetical protein